MEGIGYLFEKRFISDDGLVLEQEVYGNTL
jgi:hypothetical protein